MHKAWLNPRRERSPIADQFRTVSLADRQAADGIEEPKPRALARRGTQFGYGSKGALCGL